MVQPRPPNDRYCNAPDDWWTRWRDNMQLRPTIYVTRGDRIAVVSEERYYQYHQATFIAFNDSNDHTMFIKWDRRPGVINEYVLYDTRRLRVVHQRRTGITYELLLGVWTNMDNVQRLRSTPRVDYSKR